MQEFDIEWERPLKKRVGGSNLGGLEVLYDFTWKNVFSHEKTTFPNGKRLASFAREHCPEGKTPCLLLTTIDHVEEKPIQSATRYALVVRISRYLQTSSADPATTYFAQGKPLYELHNAESIRLWASGNSSRLEILRQILDSDPGAEETHSPPRNRDLANMIRALDHVTPELCDAMVKALGLGGADEIRRVAENLSSTTDGRQAASEALLGRIENRIEDAFSHVSKYRQLLDDTKTTEHDLQSFIKRHHSLLGLEYVRVRSRQGILRGEVDFLVERHDGYHDLLELKRSDDEIIRCHGTTDGPQPASSYSLAPALSNALAQVQVYRDQLTRTEGSMEAEYGIRQTGHPRVIIIVGREDAEPSRKKQILRQLNLSLHRIEVVPYDRLAKRAETQLRNLKKILLASGASAEERPE